MNFKQWREGEGKHGYTASTFPMFSYSRLSRISPIPTETAKGRHWIMDTCGLLLIDGMCIRIPDTKRTTSSNPLTLEWHCH